MPFYHHNAQACFGERGVGQAQIDTLLARLAPALAELAARKSPQAAPIINLPSRTDDLAGILALAADIRRQFKHVVVAGLGGSSLSGRALSEFKPNSILHFLENIDPDAIDSLLAKIDGERTCFIIISKSGTTVETLGQFYVLLDRFKDTCRERFIVITGKNDSPLRQTAGEHGMRILNHPDDIGGRFAIFTEVGLLPAAIAGIDIKALRAGAASVVKTLESAKPNDCLPALGAALQYAFLEKGHNISVMLPYGERLSGFSSWYRQCWAESLGKGGKGSTPIRAVGTTDQHSQLQLYLGGPRDKLFHLITVKRAGSGHKIHAPASDELAYLQGKTTGDLMEAEQKALYETLKRHHCPVRLFELEKLGEEELGALLMHFMLEIMCMAHLLGVNAFDQPAVEEGKKLARGYLLTGTL